MSNSPREIAPQSPTPAPPPPTQPQKVDFEVGEDGVIDIRGDVKATATKTHRSGGRNMRFAQSAIALFVIVVALFTLAALFTTGQDVSPAFNAGPYTCEADTECWPNGPVFEVDTQWTCAWTNLVQVGDDGSPEPPCHRGDTDAGAMSPQQAVDLGRAGSTSLWLAAAEKFEHEGMTIVFPSEPPR